MALISSRPRYQRSRLWFVHQEDTNASCFYREFRTSPLVIGADGAVESVTVLEGNPEHAPSATAAFKQWRFSPFTRDGKAVRALVKMKIYVPDGLATPEEIANVTASNLRHECSRLVDAMDAGAVATCTKAVEAAEQLPANAVLERSGTRAWLGHALLLQRRPREALAEYMQELALVQRVVGPDEAELASAYRHIGTAHFALVEMADADTYFGRAVTVMEGAIRKLPSERPRYLTQLQDILREHAHVKRATGNHAAAEALEKKAATLFDRI